MEFHSSCSKKARHSDLFCSDNAHFINDIDEKGLMPLRLLELRSDATHTAAAEECSAYLTQPDSVPAESPYVALSHQWGPGKMLKTTTSNVDELMSTGVSIQKLPRTFRKAACITQALGYSYLWIDCLCIIQDDERDWKREARRMAIIYDKAVCTILAMDGFSSTDFDGKDVPMPSSTTEPLDNRAWACQERMISPRSLIMTRQTLDWECRECNASRNHPMLTKRSKYMSSRDKSTHPKDISHSSAIGDCLPRHRKRTPTQLDKTG